MKFFLKKFIPLYALIKWRNFLQQYKFRKYIGDDVYCSICQSSFKIFLPFGIVERKNAQCHKCGSLERHRLIWKYIQEKAPFNFESRNLSVLHFAPESCFSEILSRRENIRYFPCDLYPEYYTNEKLQITRADITDIPFPANFFDVILCNHVLEHIPDDIKAMSEMHRVLKNDGWGIFQVPVYYDLVNTYEDFSITDPEERLKAFGQVDHVRRYGTDYKERLESAGFKVTEDNYIQSFKGAEIFKFGFNPDELIYLCQK